MPWRARLRLSEPLRRLRRRLAIWRRRDPKPWVLVLLGMALGLGLLLIPLAWIGLPSLLAWLVRRLR